MDNANEIYSTINGRVYSKGLFRIILNDGDSVNDETGIKHSDLTAEGRKFYSFGIIPWIRKIDRSRNPEKAIRDISFLEKKKVEFENL